MNAIASIDLMEEFRCGHHKSINRDRFSLLPTVTILADQPALNQRRRSWQLKALG